jgi:hypothetical protein
MLFEENEGLVSAVLEVLRLKRYIFVLLFYCSTMFICFSLSS